jgi:hypothetical protein
MTTPGGELSLKPGEPGQTTMLTAGSKQTWVTIAATSPKCPRRTLTFHVIRPTGLLYVLFGEPIHNWNSVDIGMELEVYVQPDSVSFANLSWLEDEVLATCTGVFNPCRFGHNPNPTPIEIGDDVPGLGSKMHGLDTAYHCTTRKLKFERGTVTYLIPTRLVLGGTTAFLTTTKQHAALSSGVLTIEKGASPNLPARAEIHVDNVGAPLPPWYSGYRCW